MDLKFASYVQMTQYYVYTCLADNCRNAQTDVESNSQSISHKVNNSILADKVATVVASHYLVTT